MTWTILEQQREYNARPEVRERCREKARVYRKVHAAELKVYRAERYLKNVVVERERHRNSHLKFAYGITADVYSQMYIVQDGKCAICKKPFDRLCVDHDHETDEVRALLCLNCNSVIGQAFDDAGILQSALEYVLAWRRRGQ